MCAFLFNMTEKHNFYTSVLHWCISLFVASVFEPCCIPFIKTQQDQSKEDNRREHKIVKQNFLRLYIHIRVNRWNVRKNFCVSGAHNPVDFIETINNKSLVAKLSNSARISLYEVFGFINASINQQQHWVYGVDRNKYVVECCLSHRIHLKCDR